MKNHCHICDNTFLTTIPNYPELCRVTSDCRPWKKEGTLCLCNNCNTVQSIVDLNWQNDAEKIYEGYEIYHQGGGSEQLVFIDGIAVTRSQRIIAGIIQNYSISLEGRILDIGCGNGSFLRNFHEFRPNFKLSGTEKNDHEYKNIETLPEFENLWVCSPQEVIGTYDIITMIHLLEHIISPVSFLKEVKDKLSGDGIIVIEVPDYCKNPFDLIIADHATHFSVDTLCLVVELAGFEIIWKSDSWIPKEISLIAQKKSTIHYYSRIPNLNKYGYVEKSINWLTDIRTKVKDMAVTGPIGVFGSSIAATWVFGEIGEKIAFFVDEDPSRIGRRHLGIPIISPKDIPREFKIFFPMQHEIACEISKRLFGFNIN